MESKSTQELVVKEATKAIRCVVNAFDFLRSGNPLLDSFLENINLALEIETEILSDCIQEEEGCTAVESVIAKYTGPLPNPSRSSLKLPSPFSQLTIPRTRKSVRFQDDFNLNSELSLSTFSFAESSSLSTHRAVRVKTQRKNLTLFAEILEEPESDSDNVELSETESDSEAEKTSNESPEEKVFAISELVHHIFTHFSPSSLKICRIVNKKFSSEATSLLLRKESLSIQFKFDEETETFILHSPNKALTITKTSSFSERNTATLCDLKLLCKLLENTPEILQSSSNTKFNFPCQYFVFKGGSLTNPDLQMFLKKHGHLVKHLSIELSNSNANSNSNSTSEESYILHNFRNLLQIQLPNLESLQLSNFPQLWQNSYPQLFPEPRTKSKSSLKLLENISPIQKPSQRIQLFPVNFNRTLLPKLTSIHFQNLPPKSIFKDLILVSPNIKSIGFDRNCDLIINWLLQINLLHLLKSIELILLPQNFTLYLNLPVENIRLKKFLFNCDHYVKTDPGKLFQAMQIISKFLKVSAESLEDFHMQPLGSSDGDSYSFQYDILTEKSFPRVKRIRISDGNPRKPEEKYFPSNIHFSKLFPSLERLEFQESEFHYYNFYYKGYLDSNWREQFGGIENDRHFMMKYLSFIHGPPGEGIGKFPGMFPNLTIVKVGLVDHFPVAAKGFWALEYLEELEFGIEVGEQGEFNEYPAVDEGFTGFSKKNCKKLYEKSRKVDVETLEGLRENKSLLDAKYLRKIVIKIHDSGQRKLVEKNPAFPYLTHVTGLFAFSYCTQLHVTIVASANNEPYLNYVKNGLSPILPYVHSVMESIRPSGVILSNQILRS